VIPEALRENLETQVKDAAHPRELVVDVMMALQDHYGWLTDEAVAETAGLLGMTHMEVEEVATFYTFIYREKVGRYVIHVCDSLVCWLDGGYTSLRDYLIEKLNIGLGETTADGLFTLLPVCCIGYCDRSPAVLINKKAYGPLTPEKLDEILERLRKEAD